MGLTGLLAGGACMALEVCDTRDFDGPLALPGCLILQREKFRLNDVPT
jgi:hypothetical protein